MVDEFGYQLNMVSRLQYDKTWVDCVDKMWTPEALTSVVLGKYHIWEYLTKEINQELLQKTNKEGVG